MCGVTFLKILSCIYCAQCAVWGTPFLVFHSVWHKPRSNNNWGVADLIPYMNQIWCSFLALPVRAACNVMFHRKHWFKSHKWQIVLWLKYFHFHRSSPIVRTEFLKHSQTNAHQLELNNKCTKVLTLEITIFGLKMTVKNYFEIPRASSELLLPSAKQDGRYSDPKARNG